MKLIILQTNMASSVVSLIIIVLVLIGLFFLLRGINLWYWKINEIIDNQKSIIQLLSKMSGETKKTVKQDPDSKQNSIQAVDIPDGFWMCNECSHVNPDSELYCKKCKYINPNPKK